MTKDHRSLDVRLAEALANEDTRAATFSDLLIEIDHALSGNQKALEAERSRMLSPTNPDPQKSKDMVDKIILAGDRLEAALPVLEARYKKARRKEQFAGFLPEYNRVVERHNECSQSLLTLYCDFIEQFVPMLDAAVELNGDIRKMNADTHSKGFHELKSIPTVAERLLDGLVLPAEQNGVNYWPDSRATTAFALAWADTVARTNPLQQMAYSPDWAEARQISDEAKIKEWEKRNALQEGQQAKAKQEFYEAQKQAARGS